MAPSRILVVDDQKGVRQLLETFFTEQGMVTYLASNGEEALALMVDHQPDLVLMDVKMPVMDGVEALARMKEICPEQQVLMMTAYADEEKISQLLELGAVDCLVKPLDLNQLLQYVETLTGNSEKRF
ncbi:MAG: response regulator [Clostridia bacterium]|nr:response regulator [Clostridia bacterium]